MAQELEQMLDTQHTINQLRSEAAGADEHAYLDAEQHRLDQERARVLGRRVGEVSIGRDGVVVDKAVLEQETAAGHEASGPYNNGQR